jgi:hypothetical protein
MVRHHPNGCAAMLLACGFLLTGLPPARADGRLDDPAPAARLRAALALAGAHDSTAIPVLIDSMLEVDRAGKEVHTINRVPRVIAACRSPRGEIVARTQTGQCVRRDATGKQLGSSRCRATV